MLLFQLLTCLLQKRSSFRFGRHGSVKIQLEVQWLFDALGNPGPSDDAVGLDVAALPPGHRLVAGFYKLE